MRIVVDLTKCQGYAQCAFLAPEVFTHPGGRGADRTTPTLTTAQRTRIRRAAAACPVQAIRLDQMDGPTTIAGIPDRPRRGRAPADPPADGGSHVQANRADRHRRRLAGRAAGRGTLREEGFTGLADPDRRRAARALRPAAAVQAGAGRARAARATPRCPARRDIDAEWRLGVAATGLDLAGQAGAARRRQPDRVRPVADRHRRAGPALAEPGGGRAGRRVDPAHPGGRGPAAAAAGRPAAPGAGHRRRVHRLRGRLRVPRTRPAGDRRRGGARPRSVARSAA